MTTYHKVEPKDNMIVTNTTVEAATDGARPKATPVLKVKPTKAKKGLISRMVNGVIGPDGFRRIGDYIKHDIVVPALKNIIAESIKSGIDMALFPGENRTRSNRSSDVRVITPRVNYADKFAESKTTITKPARVYQYVDEYAIPDRRDAAEVLGSLIGFAEKYGNVSVADYYDMLNVPSVFTDHNFGWSYENIKQSIIMPTNGGHIIKFPPLEKVG